MEQPGYVFGLALDDAHYYHGDTTAAFTYVGPTELLNLLETLLDIAGEPPVPGQAALRVEYYRQHLDKFNTLMPDSFFGRSLKSDPLATAAAVLAMRDELILGDWQPQDVPPADAPERISQLWQIEQQLLTLPPVLPLGLADRVSAVVAKLRTQVVLPAAHLHLHTPEHLLPPHWQRIIGLLSRNGWQVEHMLAPALAPADTDLGRWQRSLLRRSQHQSVAPAADGSLQVWTAPREADAAELIARLLWQHPEWKPLLLVPPGRHLLDVSLWREGLQPLGITSSPAARPATQVLRLLYTFLWQPLNPHKVLEFLTLHEKPLPSELASSLSRIIAEYPGVHGPAWAQAVARYFEVLEATAGAAELATARQQYSILFRRRQYDSTSGCPIAEAISLYEHLLEWVQRRLQDAERPGSALYELQQQSHSVLAILRARSDYETTITALQLERLVDSVFEPTGLVLFGATTDAPPRLHHLHQPDALVGGVAELLWWNFAGGVRPPQFTRWYAQERVWLEAYGIQLPSVTYTQDVQYYQRNLPVLSTGRRLVLVVPERLDGRETVPHALMGELEATFGRHLAAITYPLQHPDTPHRLRDWWAMPELDTVSVQLHHAHTPPYLYLQPATWLQTRSTESFSSLQSLFYYPHQWVFRYQCELNATTLQAVTDLQTLYGNLAHRLFERFFDEYRERLHQVAKADIEQWVAAHYRPILEQQGATLLLHGAEARRNYLERRIKRALLVLTDHLRSNDWEIVHIEHRLEGELATATLDTRADLIVRRKGGEYAVIDLKWGGIQHRLDTLRSRKDLQLTLYARLVAAGSWAHSAYFLIDSARLIARNRFAFREAQVPGPADADHVEAYEQIWGQMQHTYAWRLRQLQSGVVEIRTARTSAALDVSSDPDTMLRLEMHGSTDPFDPYLSLVEPLA